MPMAAHVAAGMHWGVHGVPYHAESTLSSAQVLKGRIGEPHGRTIYDHVDVCALHLEASLGATFVAPLPL